MAEGWIEAGGQDMDTPAWDREASVTGKLVNKQSNVGPNGSMLYTVETEKGKIAIWGSTVLDTKFSAIPTNSLVRVEPLGKQKSPKTGREYQDFKVSYQPGDGPVEATAVVSKDTVIEPGTDLDDVMAEFDKATGGK